MAIIGKPPVKKTQSKGSKGTPPPTSEPSTNLSKPANNILAPMNFKVEPEFKKEFKGYALDNDISMVELLRTSFDFYKNRK